jgi:glycosyltransferase involved in cell wall biosynthesis
LTRLSIIIPTKNRPDHLRRALRPLAADPSTEIIVVDDGSTCDNARRNRSLCKEVPGCRYHRLVASRGASAARNHGFALTRGAYVWFMDDDDFATPRTVRDVLDAVMERSGKEILLMPRTIVLDDTPIRLDFPANDPDKFERYRRIGIEVTTSCALFPRTIIARLHGWDEALLALQDTDLFLRAAQIAKFACLPTDPVRVDVSAPARITHAFVHSQIGKLQFLRKHWRILPTRRRLLYLAQIVGCSPLLRAPRARWQLARARRRKETRRLLGPAFDPAARLRPARAHVRSAHPPRED